jgi:hypothetical protein
VKRLEKAAWLTLGLLAAGLGGCSASDTGVPLADTAGNVSGAGGSSAIIGASGSSSAGSTSGSGGIGMGTGTGTGGMGTAGSGGQRAGDTDSGTNRADGASDATSGHREAGPPPPDPCVQGGTCPKGTWVNVTPTNVNITDPLNCSNFGTQNIGVNPDKASDFYAMFMCQGIWKSTDYGQTWKGPINTGRHGTDAGNCAGGITVADGGAGKPPILYEACIRGSIGFWASTNGGVDWDTYPVGKPAGEDIYPVAVDPYDAQHILAPSHEKGFLVESTSGGKTWTDVPLTSGMHAGCMSCGSGEIFFLDTGNAATTARTWLWMAQVSGGVYGTWRTTDGGVSWVQVDKNEHPHGESQIYSAGGNVIYMAGSYSAKGSGVLRSSDLGQTWVHESNLGGAVVWGTAKNVYSAYSWANGLGKTDSTNFVIAPAPGTSGWTAATTPSGMIEGPAQVATAFDGSNNIFVASCWWAGVWRYIEP